MLRIKSIIILFLFVFLGYTSSAQDTEQVRTIIVKTENIDSINADKLLKEFILSHKPLTINQLNIFNRPKKSGTYGEYVSTYMVESKFYRIDLLPQKRVVTQKVHPNQEWIFYMFVIWIYAFKYQFKKGN